MWKIANRAALRSVRFRKEDREPRAASVYPYGKAPAGLLRYDSTRHMAAQVMKNPPHDFASDDRERFTTQEKVAPFDGYVAYFWRFKVDVSRKVVSHLPDAHLSRRYIIGRREERHYQLRDDELVLCETWQQSGASRSGVRVFQRVR